MCGRWTWVADSDDRSVSVAVGHRVGHSTKYVFIVYENNIHDKVQFDQQLTSWGLWHSRSKESDSKQGI